MENSSWERAAQQKFAPIRTPRERRTRQHKAVYRIAGGIARTAPLTFSKALTSDSITRSEFALATWRMSRGFRILGSKKVSGVLDDAVQVILGIEEVRRDANAANARSITDRN